MTQDITKRRERGSGRIWQIGRIWWIQFYSHGRKIRESSGSDQEFAAKKLLKRRLSEVELRVHRPVRRLRYEEIRDGFIADYVTKRRRSLRFDSEGKPRPLDKVQRLNRYFEGFHVEDIDSDSLTKFVAGLQQQGKKDATINRSLSCLRRMFHLARKRGKLRDVPHFEMLRESEARKGFFEPAQYESLLAALPDYLRPVLTIAFHTAMRSGEVRSIKWSQVDFLNNVIRLDAEQTKGNTARQIPIFGELKKTLLAQHARRQPDCPYVCFRISSTGHALPIGDFRKVWQDRCVKLGLGKWVQAVDANGQPKFEKRRGPRSKPKPKMVYEGLLVHDLRRSGVRNLVRAGVSETVARRISGHKTREIFSRYDITSDKDLNDAAQKLEKYLSKNGPSLGQISEERPSKSDLPN